ncbi:hypothetical protein CBS101457_005591 [Exobasidium rhododendri]|nr:hypothetical protein CBS101457_005591 [Exobasidium rhododendri]
MPSYKVAVIPGDGIGKEVMIPGLKALEACAKIYDFQLDFTHFDFACCDYYEKHGQMLPDDWVQILKPFDAIFFGAVGDPKRVPDHISLWGSLLSFRRQFDQYVNIRPVRLIPGIPCPLRDPGNSLTDLFALQENTEGEYSNAGGRIFEGTEREIVIQETIMTRVGVDRILKFAFDLAQSRPRKKLTSATKSNGISITMPFWDERVKEMSKKYADVTQYHIDILTAHFVQRPASFDVVVGSNLFGDILSDLGPGCMGSLGLAASGNINPTREWPSLFEPVHGSANDIMGLGLANPVGQVEAGAMMLRHLGQEEAADAIVHAVNVVLGRSNKEELTKDLGGHGSTTSLGDAIIAAIKMKQ